MNEIIKVQFKQDIDELLTEEKDLCNKIDQFF